MELRRKQRGLVLSSKQKDAHQRVFPRKISAGGSARAARLLLICKLSNSQGTYGGNIVGTCRRSLTVLCTMLLCISCAACGAGNANDNALSAADIYGSGHTDKSTSQPSSTAASQAEDAAPWVSPFDAYFLEGEREHVVDQARDRLVRACMTSQGFEYQGDAGGSDDADSGANADFAATWGPSDEDTARQYGYAAPSTANSDGNAAASASYPSGYMHALINEENTGCIDQADARLGYGDTWFSAMGAYEKIRDDADAKALAANKVRQVMQQWEACMSNRGYANRDPRELVGKYADRQAGTSPDTAEQKAAMADAACKVSTGFMQIIRESYTEAERQAVLDNQATMDQIKQLSETIYANAKRELA